MLLPLKPDEGTAAVSMAANTLASILSSLPESYRVIGSRDSHEAGQVVLIMASTDVIGVDIKMRALVSDAGSTRTIAMVPLTWDDHSTDRCG